MVRAWAWATAILSLLLLAGAPVAADWVASGTVHYRDREFGPTGFTGVEPLLPVRLADVEVLDATAQTVLASGSTDATGAFSLNVPDDQVRDVVVRVLTRALQIPDLNLEVTLGDGTPYAIVGPVVAGHLPDADLDAGVLVAEIGQGGEAFNCWDNGVWAADFMAYLTGARPGPTDFLSVVWEIDRGQPASVGSFSRIDMRDSSGYDDTVLLHEYGHYVVFNFSDSDNPGGAHGFAQCDQDPRLSWEEGHATFFGAAIRRHFNLPLPNIYLRTTGEPGPGHAALYADLETETAYQCSGSTSEVAIFTALWDLIDGPADMDFTPGFDDMPLDPLNLDVSEHWDVMANGLPGRSSITAEDYWDAWFEAPVVNGYRTEMISIFSGVEIEYFEDGLESNGDRETAQPLLLDTAPLHATFFLDPDADGSGGGAADADWFAFDAVAGMNYRIETLNLWSDADTIVNVRDDSGPALASNDDRAAGDPSSRIDWIPPVSGRFYVEVVQAGDATPYGSYDLLFVPPPDQDSDGVPNTMDLCPNAPDPGQENEDGDLRGDACDNCPQAPNDAQLDADADGRGDLCDVCPLDPADDSDADGVCADADNCPDEPNAPQSDFDQDAQGDACDNDDGLIYLSFAQPDRVEWQGEGFGKWNSYRGDLALLRSTGAYTQDPLLSGLAERDCRVRNPYSDLADPLPSGETVFFLITGVQGSSESGLGTDHAGSPRPNDNPCP